MLCYDVLFCSCFTGIMMIAGLFALFGIVIVWVCFGWVVLGWCDVCDWFIGCGAGCDVLALWW